jgi:hypothetical protein
MKRTLLAACALGVLGLFAAACSSVNNAAFTRVGGTVYYTGEFKNTSGGEVLQHNFLVEFLDASGNVVGETKTLGCLRSLHPNQFDLFEAQTSVATGAVAGRARLAIDSVITAGPLTSGELSLQDIEVDHNDTRVRITGNLRNNGDETVTNPRVCSGVYDTGNRVIRVGVSDLGDLSPGEDSNFSVILTVSNDQVFVGRVDLYADGLIDDQPIRPISSKGH